MLHTRICDLLGIRYPIVNAPMSGTATAGLAIAVSEGGGFGLIGGTTSNGPEWLRAQIRIAKERTARPFGVGFISSFPGLDDLVWVALEERVAAISHSFADPTPYVVAAHAAGVKILAQVQTVAQAKIAALAGVDVITAQGSDAGGHTGYVGTFSMVPAVVEVAGDIPVLAAGGIADGRGLAAALLLGAEGAWIGTRFVASREGAIAGWVKERIVGASTDDTVLTHAYDLTFESPFPAGIGDRVLRNDFTSAWHDRDEDVVARREELRREVTTAMESGNACVAPARAGSASGLIHGIEPAADIIWRIVTDAEEILRSRPARLLGEHSGRSDGN